MSAAGLRSRSKAGSTVALEAAHSGAAEPGYELLAELPSSSSSLGSDRTSARSQGKLATVEEEVPMDRETRRMARRSELTEGDDQYPGAKGTKDAPGRFTSRSHRTSPYLLSQANPWVWKTLSLNLRRCVRYSPPSPANLRTRARAALGGPDRKLWNSSFPARRL